MSKDYLFVIDGVKGVRKAIEEQFGSKAIVQRCKGREAFMHLKNKMQKINGS